MQQLFFIILMRNLFIYLLLLCSFHANAQESIKRVITALENIEQGYAQYGINELKEAATKYNTLEAQYYIAVCHEKGIVLEQNLTEAFKWYRRAAERGLPDAMYQLAYFYKNGIVVSKNEIRSNEWMKRYNDKGGKMLLPDILSIYNEGLKHPENYAMTPNGGSNVSGSAQASNKTNSQVINQITVVQQNQTPTIQINEHREEKASAKSDVDVNIPVNPQNNENTFALIIANENYQTVEKVSNALNDGHIFAEYCKKTLGLPKSNVHFIADATLNNIKREINLINQIASVYGKSSKLIVYYAGHGIPDEATHSAYLLPIDGYLSDLTTCYSLNNLYNSLGEMPSSQIVVLIDACFSGSMRGDGMLASARGVAIKAKPETASGNMIILSASQGDETAYSIKEQGHGLFTYYLLKKLQETKGDVSLGILANFIKENVMKKSLVINGKLQTPTIIPSDSVSDCWENWTLRH